MTGSISLVKQAAPWLALAVLLVLLERQALAGPLRGGLEWQLFKVQQATGQIGGNLLKPLINWQNFGRMSGRLADLEQRTKQLAVDYSRLAAVEAENERLKALLVQPGGNPSQVMVAAGLLSGSRGTMVDKGRREGVVEGAVVVDAQGVLVGRVRLLRERVSLLERPFEPASRMAVKLAGLNTTGVLTGKGETVVLEGVLQAELLRDGDVVVTSGADTLYPPEIVVGVVSQVLGEAADLTKGAAVELTAAGEAVRILIESQ